VDPNGNDSNGCMPNGVDCAPPKTESPPGFGMCVCPAPFTHGGKGGCTACLDPLGNPTNGCLQNGADCVPPKVESPPCSGICGCPDPCDHDVKGGCKACKDANFVFNMTTRKCVCRT